MSGVPNARSGINSSPVKYSIQGSQHFAAYPMKAKEMKNQLASELHCHWVGPMPVDEFFEAFLNVKQEDLAQMPVLPDHYFDAMPQVKKESEMYKPFIDLVTDSHIAPTLKLLDTSDHTDKDAGATMKNKPDVTAYDANANVTAAQPLSYSQAEVIFEFKPSKNSVDPFEDLSKEGTDADLYKFIWEPSSEGRQECRGQIACYARAWMASQHRTHCFVLWIGDPDARIIRFDRSGAIVTKKFSIRSQSRLLLQFLWRISCASPEMRGQDTTVSVVTDPVEVKFTQEKLKEWTPQRPRRVMKLKIPDGGPADNPDMREVLVWGPLADPYGVVGRATRGYPGWDLKDEKLVFVKDSWRVVEADVSKETDILQTLNKADVCNVPTFLCGDDLPGQSTRTQDFASSEWNRGGQPETFSKRAHIRFTSDTIGIPLVKFKSSKDFVEAWLDAFLAHEEAYTKCKILHRDISINNILFKPGGGGFLNDWDLARTIDDIEAGPRQPSRSGTWQFMSIGLLVEPDKKHTLQDDLEAFFWVLLYVTIRYLFTSLVESRNSIPETMRTIFDMAATNHRGTVGGAYKQQVVVQRSHIGWNFKVTKNEPLSALIHNILDILYDYVQYLTTFQAQTYRLVVAKDISVEEATEVLRAKEKDFDFCSHVAIVAFARKAIAKEWPSGDCPFDYCATPGGPTTVAMTSSKRRADNEPPKVGSGTDPERKTKRMKKDDE